MENVGYVGKTIMAIATFGVLLGTGYYIIKSDISSFEREQQRQQERVDAVTTLAVESREFNGDGIADLVVTLTNGNRIFLVGEEHEDNHNYWKITDLEELEALNNAYEENSKGFY